MNQDIREAVLTLACSPTMRNEGIDEAFGAMLARNIKHLDKLPTHSAEQMRKQFAVMAFDLSSLEGIGRIHSEDKSKQLATWLKQTNLLLVLVKTWRGKI